MGWLYVLTNVAWLSLVIMLTRWLRAEERRWRSAYDYAVAHADFTEAGRAYSDIATVLVLADEPLEDR